jgi:hypothetical protein
LAGYARVLFFYNLLHTQMAKQKIKLVCFKVHVRNQKQSAEMQEVLATKDIHWAGERGTYQLLPTPCYIIARGMVLTYVKHATNTLPTFTIEEINKL